jgi:hypothetical protein
LGRSGFDEISRPASDELACRAFEILESRDGYCLARGRELLGRQFCLEPLEDRAAADE